MGSNAASPFSVIIIDLRFLRILPGKYSPLDLLFLELEFLVGVNIPESLLVNSGLFSGVVGLVLGLVFNLCLDIILLSDPGADMLSWLSLAVIDGNSCGGKCMSLVLNDLLLG